jgi:hypothetical protein
MKEIYIEDAKIFESSSCYNLKEPPTIFPSKNGEKL